MGYQLHHEPMLENKLPLPLQPLNHWIVRYAVDREQYGGQILGTPKAGDLLPIVANA